MQSKNEVYRYVEQLENAFNAVIAWQGIQGLNLYCRSQSAVCYHYTNSLCYVPCRHSSRSGEESELLLTGAACVIKEKGCLSITKTQFDYMLSAPKSQ